MRIKKLFRGFVPVVLFAALICPALPAAAAETAEFKLVSVVVGEGANIWLPSTLIVKEGKEVKLTVQNMAGKEHGLTIEGLGVEEVIPDGQSKTLTIRPKKKGVYRYYCHLHKGHIGGQILVK